MRDFFIRGYEIVLTLVIVAAAVGVAVAAIGAMIGPISLGAEVAPLQGPYAAAAILLGGWLAVLVIGGALYLGLGIYHNTQRTADALELLITLRR
ncbi:hypothetical protein [Jannaschia sp. 2305UL9-9]|uniref:hypothetical protein n=1 Tax=Jannaschia sp. 2305UL9-9 TaxID=3121638 RepID=UPI0035296367